MESKYNIFVSGGTGSGKTTFLNALSDYIPKDERIITIEDNAELQIKGVSNLVRLEARNANLEGEGAVTIRDLIKSAPVSYTHLDVYKRQGTLSSGRSGLCKETRSRRRKTHPSLYDVQ